MNYAVLNNLTRLMLTAIRLFFKSLIIKVYL